jgi:ribosomal protein S19E (S16A)
MFVRIYSARKQKEIEKNNLPDSRDLVKQLLLFLETAPDPPHWKFMAQASMLLREWLVAELGLSRSARGGTGSIFFEAIESQIPARFRKEIQQILLMADHAAALESGTEKDDFMTRIAALVRSIRTHQDRAQAGS